jgi:hypothetical protein
MSALRQLERDLTDACIVHFDLERDAMLGRLEEMMVQAEELTSKRIFVGKTPLGATRRRLPLDASRAASSAQQHLSWQKDVSSGLRPLTPTRPRSTRIANSSRSSARPAISRRSVSSQNGSPIDEVTDRMQRCRIKPQIPSFTVLTPSRGTTEPGSVLATLPPAPLTPTRMRYALGKDATGSTVSSAISSSRPAIDVSDGWSHVYDSRSFTNHYTYANSLLQSELQSQAEAGRQSPTPLQSERSRRRSRRRRGPSSSRPQ